MVPVRATPIYRSRFAYGRGFVEAVVWQVPQPISPSEHRYEYCLAHVVDGERVVGYDNERGKSDHKHFGAVERPYVFKNPAQLMLDFMADVDEARNE